MLLVCLKYYIEMFLDPLPADAKPSILFRAECSSNTSFREGYLCARKRDKSPPSRKDFDDHLSWNQKPTRFLSFGTWRRAMQQRKILEDEGRVDIVVIAVWVEGLAGVYSAEEAASRLEYIDTGLGPRKSPHYEEYLVEGGIAADEYRILAVFEGGGLEHDAVFEYPSYRIQATIPSLCFLGRGSSYALEDIEHEIYSHSGVRDDMKRDVLVEAITGNQLFFPTLRYKYPGQSENLAHHRTKSITNQGCRKT